MRHRDSSHDDKPAISDSLKRPGPLRPGAGVPSLPVTHPSHNAPTRPPAGWARAGRAFQVDVSHGGTLTRSPSHDVPS